MLTRVAVIALNTYREAVRARILHGLFVAALAAGGYSLIVGAFALSNQLRVVSDLGAMFVSLFGLVTAVVLISTSLHREVELKTVFPILARPVRRAEYVVGKFLGTSLTLLVFIQANVAALLCALGALSGRSLGTVLTLTLGVTLIAGLLGWFLPRWRSYLPLPWAVGLLALGWFLASPAPQDRWVLVGLGLLTALEVGIVTSIATVFASFSSPFLTAVFSFGILIVGRSADSLGRLPAKFFGTTLAHLGALLAKIVPNLMVYVPPRPLLLGEVPESPVFSYLTLALLQALLWVFGMLAFASVVFSRRDFL